MKIFMISYGGGHSNIIGSVYKELLKTPDNKITYAALTGASLKFTNTCINFITASDLAKLLPYYEEIYKLGYKYGLSYHNKEYGLPQEETICYYGIGMHDLISKYGEDEAEYQFEKMNRKSFLPVASMKHILRKLQPDVCVITTSPRMEKATGIAAGELGIPVVRINDLPVCEHIVHPCYLCVMNKWAKNYALVKSGIPESNIFVTGQPTFEEDISIPKEYVNNIKASVGAHKYKKIITFFTENGFDQSKEYNLLVSIANKMNDVLFIIKLHPNQPLSTYTSTSCDNIYITNGDARPFFHFSDLIITTWSTTGMQAAFFNIPVIVIKFNNRKYPLDYVEMGLATQCDNAEELERIIQTYLDKNSIEYKSLIGRQHDFQYVENASYNISKIIKLAYQKSQH